MTTVAHPATLNDRTFSTLWPRAFSSLMTASGTVGSTLSALMPMLWGQNEP